jgi:hypothetical protein
MYQLVLETNYEITKRLKLKYLCVLLLVNKRLSMCVTDQNFWRLKLEHDYNILNKKSHQTWLDRYKLTRSMGKICMRRTPNASSLSDIGTPFDIGLGMNKYDTQILNIKAISAFLDNGAVYYITDELEFYISNKKNVDNIYKTELIDSDVTYIMTTGCLILYIKNGDLYIYINKFEKIKLTSTQNIIQISAEYNIINYVTNDGVCYHINADNYIIDNYNKYGRGYIHEEIMQNVNKVIATEYGSLILMKDGNLKTTGICEFEGISITTGIIDIFGYLTLLTIDNGIVFFESFMETYYGEPSINHFRQFNDFNNINHVGNKEKFCLTKKGDVYLFTKYNNIIKLSIKAKNIFDCPGYVIMIV